MKDFDTVLSGSKRLLNFAYKGKILWTLALPVVIVTYILISNQTPNEDQVNVEESMSKEVQSDLSEATIKEQYAKKQEENRAVSAKIAVTETEDNSVVTPAQEKFEQPSDAIESSKDLLKEDIYLKAQPIAGFEDFYAFIDKELTYPELARKDSITGQVKVLFAIDEKGKVDNVTILESLGVLFDNEAIRVIKRLPDWNAATFNGEPVLSRMSIVLSFKIQ